MARDIVQIISSGDMHVIFTSFFVDLILRSEVHKKNIAGTQIIEFVTEKVEYLQLTVLFKKLCILYKNERKAVFGARLVFAGRLCKQH